MAIILRTFASGDTDYIAKMNQNVATLTAAIDLLQLQAAAASGGSAVSLGLFMYSLFNGDDALIGPESYFPTQSSTQVSVAAGGMYLNASQLVVSSLIPTVLEFSGQASDTYYIVVSTSGVPSVTTTPGTAGTTYSVVWNGVSFVGDPVRIAPVFYDTTEAEASRSSAALGSASSPVEVIDYHTLDDRWQAGEEVAMTANQTADEALAFAYELQGMIPAASTAARKVGCTVDDTTGLKGAIQIDFAGTIVGWSVIADAVGTLEVEVSRAPSSPPPSAPAIPDPVTDLITASAPIELTAAQSAATDDTGVSTWDVDLAQWDVLQFNVAAVTTITRATLYLRIQET